MGYVHPLPQGLIICLFDYFVGDAYGGRPWFLSGIPFLKKINILLMVIKLLKYRYKHGDFHHIVSCALSGNTISKIIKRIHPIYCLWNKFNFEGVIKRPFKMFIFKTVFF
jgi:hypothetical protein